MPGKCLIFAALKCLLLRFAKGVMVVVAQLVSASRPRVGKVVGSTRLRVVLFINTVVVAQLVRASRPQVGKVVGSTRLRVVLF